MFNWFKKESPLLGLMGSGGGLGYLSGKSVEEGWDSFSNATIFNHTGSDQSFSVPGSTTKIGFLIWGAAGGSYKASSRSATDYTVGGSGGYTEGIVSVTGGETLIIVVGAGGAGTNGAAAGYGGGGDGGHTNRGAGEWGSAGGGMSGIFASPGTVYSGNSWQGPAGPRAIAIAGGGAGSGLGSSYRITSVHDSNTTALNPDGFSYPGPAPLSIVRGNWWHEASGGGARGENGGTMFTPSTSPPHYVIGPGNPGSTTASEGGYQTGGGRGVEASSVDGGSGSQGQGGDGGDAPWEYAGGGGGGGWYGGGGGGASWPSPAYQAGGGGSGFIGNTAIATYGSAGTSESNTFSGPSPHNSREYELAFTVNAPRKTSEVVSDNYTPIYLSTVASAGPYYGSNAGKAPSSGSGALTGNNGRVVIRY